MNTVKNIVTRSYAIEEKVPISYYWWEPKYMHKEKSILDFCKDVK